MTAGMRWSSGNHVMNPHHRKYCGGRFGLVSLDLLR